MSKTILLTGISGFIAKRIALDLLEAGYTVRGSLRAMDRADEVRAALRPKLGDTAALDRLGFVKLDLTDDAGWPEAMEGVDVLMHTASPFPMTQPKNAEAIVRPAVDGTRRALKAAQAAGVRHVVLTSSTVAVMYNEAAKFRPVTEADWSEPNHTTVSPYSLSKTLAEQAAWEFMANHPEMSLTTINPGLVAGTPMDDHFGTSLALIERLLSGKDPALPEIVFPVVHLDDVSRLHVQAVSDPALRNTRNIAAADTRSMVEMGRLLASAFPNRKIARMKAPKFLLTLLSYTDPALKGVLPQVGIRYRIDNSATRARSSNAFTAADDAILEAARYLASR